MTVEIENYDIRYSEFSDEVLLKSWLLCPEILQYFPMDNEKEVDLAVRAWISYSKYHASLTATIGGQPCGMATLFLMPYKKVAHHCLFKLIVDPKWHRKGVGTSLLRNIKHLAKERFHLEMLFTDVFEDNPLIILLERQQFKKYAEEKGYVKRGDRILSKFLMECDLQIS